MPTFAATQKGYANLWAKAKLTRASAAEKVARRILANRARYEKVQEVTGVPWWWVGAIHDRESGGNFAGVLHNGERIIGTNRKTRLVPAGRGPFPTWEAAAVDAVLIKGLDKITNWSIPRALYEAERFNGWGYYGKKVNSPYVWSGTSLQQDGKYVADHVWSATATDEQLGVAAVLKALFKIEPTLAPDYKPVTVTPADIGGTIVAAPVATAVISANPCFLFGAALAVLMILTPRVYATLQSKGQAMNGTKSTFASKGVWGGILAAAGPFIPVVAKAFGFDVGPDDVAQVSELLGGMVSAIGGLLAIYGRVTAAKVIG